jgi:hypothetical protein
MSSDSPDVAAAKKLLDSLTARGFRFQRTAPGEDGPVLGTRVADQWVDTVYLEGFSRDCLAWRQRRTSLLIPGANVTGLVDRRISGGALTVLGEVLTWDTGS